MRVVLGVSGGIAAYKAPDLVRRLVERASEVQVILTPNAARFVSPLALAAVSNRGVIVDQWGDPSSGGVDHIELARWADVLLIAPATANMIAKLATGIADDALSTYAVAHRTAMFIAPAMNTFMLQHPTVQANIATLKGRGVQVIDPSSGELACGDVGDGRMPDPHVLADLITVNGRRDLADRRVVITAGPTREPIDQVRYLTNRSSGKMGYALAADAHTRGARVTLISGPCSLQPPHGVEVVNVTTAAEMLEATLDAARHADVVIGSAAVADFTSRSVDPKKMRRSGSGLVLHLSPTRDILQAVAQLENAPMIVAFAAEVEEVLESAQRKLETKGATFVVANDVSDPSIGFDSDSNRVTIVSRDAAPEQIGPAPKAAIARQILDRVAARLSRGKTAAALS